MFQKAQSHAWGIDKVPPFWDKNGIYLYEIDFINISDLHLLQYGVLVTKHLKYMCHYKYCSKVKRICYNSCILSVSGDLLFWHWL